MLFFRKLFKLPTPIDLGWSKYNALESTLFSDEPKGKTWEDWHAHVKEMHPVKYWCAETAPNYLYKIIASYFRPISTMWYWLVSHVVPSRRYHMLDLRQPCIKGSEHECYRYGWADVPEKMLYAMFNLLGEYLNEEEPADLTLYYTREQIEADIYLKAQQKSFEEAKIIYYWWTVTRHEAQELVNKMIDNWYEAKKNKADNQDQLRDLYIAQEKFNEEKIDEMVIRLMKIRRNLWT